MGQLCSTIVIIIIIRLKDNHKHAFTDKIGFLQGYQLMTIDPCNILDKDTSLGNLYKFECVTVFMGASKL